MAPDNDTNSQQYRTDSYEFESRLPRTLDDGYHKRVRVPVFPASESDLAGIDSVKPHTTGSPAFYVSVDVQRSEDGESDIWGLWNPGDDYLNHSVDARGAGRYHFDQSRVAVNIEEWLNRLLEEQPEAVEEYITNDRREDN